MKNIPPLVAVMLFLCVQSANAAEAASDLPFSMRAFQCEQFEFAELDSMPAAELKGAFCSYAIGSDQSSKRAAIMKEKYKDNPAIRGALLGDHITLLQQCTRGMEKTLDVLKRKFSEQPADCKPMTAMIEARMDKAKARAAAATEAAK